MKPILKPSAAILIFTVVFSLLAVCPRVLAQTPADNNQTVEKDKREVQEFVDSFIKTLTETQDINQVPERFFAPDFGKEFCQISGSMVEKKLAEKLTSQEQIKLCKLTFNLMYLGIVYQLGRGSWAEIEEIEAKNKVEDSDDEFAPPELLKLAKNTKVFSRLEDDDFKIQTYKDFNILTAETEDINAAQRAYLKEHNLPKNESAFWEVMNDVKNVAYWKNKDGIYGNIDDKGRRYIEVGGYFTRLKIVKINNEPKIADVELLQD